MSLDGLARGEHIGLIVGDIGAGEAGIEGTGVGRGVGSFRLSTSVSVKGKDRRENGVTAGQDSISAALKRLSVEEDRL